MSGALEGRVAIVTGGGRGIGAACARLFAREGARVAIASRTESELDTVRAAIASEHGDDRVLAVPVDVSEETAIRRLFDRTIDTFGDLHVVVPNAATIVVRPFLELDPATWHRIVAVNQTGTFLTCREAFQRFRDLGHGGSIVTVGSLGGIHGTEKFPGFSAYTVTKYAVLGLTECLAVEGRDLGIRVNAVAPGAVDTAMLREAAPGLRTDTTPDEIAQSVLFLADAARSGALSGTVVEIHSNR